MHELSEMIELKYKLDNLINEAIAQLTVSEFVQLHEQGILTEGLVSSLLKTTKNLFKKTRIYKKSNKKSKASTATIPMLNTAYKSLNPNPKALSDRIQTVKKGSKLIDDKDKIKAFRNDRPTAFFAHSDK